MKVVVNGMNALVGWAEVDVSIGKMTRGFTIVNNEKRQSLFEGDIVEMYTNNGILLIRGVVEYHTIEAEYKHTYAGRNQARFIVDCYADETIQFTEKQPVQAVLEDVAGKFGLSVIGEAEMPEETGKTILIGDKYGETFLEIAKSTGQIITSDAIGNIVIADEPKMGGFSFVYGVNIRNRSFKNDSTQSYDRYVVISQNDYTKTQKQEVEVKGEYGEGDFVKVIRSEEALTADECAKLAEEQYFKDRRRGVDYTVEVDVEADIDVNTKYMVIDSVAQVFQTMNVKQFKATLDEATDKLVVTFENTKEEAE